MCHTNCTLFLSHGRLWHRSFAIQYYVTAYMYAMYAVSVKYSGVVHF